MTGRPTIEGKMDAGKLLPANPHLTNPVPLSQTITFAESVITLFPSVCGALVLLALSWYGKGRSPQLVIGLIPADTEDEIKEKREEIAFFTI
jgi:hypothetical protein